MLQALFVVLALLESLVTQPASADRVEPGRFPASWVTAATCPEDPAFRTHEYNENFFILRQSGCTNFEKPFLYLLFGRDRALLVDTGAKGADTGAAVRAALNAWAARHGGRRLPLTVVHSHGHGDHIAGDEQLAALPDTTLVRATPDELQTFFHLAVWPASAGVYDLGERVIDIIPIPGHERASIAIYDRRTRILLTGDTLYPGRLYVRDQVEFVNSIKRLVDFTADKSVTHVLGAHIENARTPYVDHAEGTRHQPDEHVLELGRAHLLELHDALQRMNGRIVRRAFRDFTIWPVE
jgi:glyoxylase-like metal-dependent hydrolase (beta-lactamase superfamily II)